MSSPQPIPPASRPKISFVIGTRNRPHLLAGLLSSLQAQTDPNWDALVMVEGGIEEYADANEAAENAKVVSPSLIEPDQRIKIAPAAMPWRKDWHQTIKKIGATAVGGEFIAFPNDDVYYVPTFVAVMHETAVRYGHDLVYCDWLNPEIGYMVHGGAPVVGHIDVGGFIVSRRAWHTHGLKGELWQCGRQTADGEFVQALAERVKHGKAPGVLYVKN
jgi:glycosyltransferase involved in cell wall biosynthesis